MTEFSWEAEALVPFRTALERLGAALQPLGVERLPLEQALGRISARDLVAPIEIPAGPISTRDGFALRSADTEGAGLLQPRQLRVVGSSFPEISAESLSPLASGEALIVASGAPLPPGADAVVAGERAAHKDPWLLVSAPLRAGSGVLPPGGEVRQGTPILSAGSVLHPLRLGLLATTGLEHIEVHRAPRVGIIAIDGASAQAPPSNAVMLSAWCARYRLTTRRWVCAASPESVSAALAEALAVSDVVLTIGGTGLGPRDLVRDALTEVSWEVIVEGIRLRPGRSSSFGLARHTPVFVLPARPVAAETAFLLLALPGITRLAGAQVTPFPEVPARLARSIKRPAEQLNWTQAIKVRLFADDYFLHAVPVVGRSSQKDQGRLQAAASGHGILLMVEGEAGLRAGDVLPVLLLEEAWD